MICPNCHNQNGEIEVTFLVDSFHTVIKYLNGKEWYRRMTRKIEYPETATCRCCNCKHVWQTPVDEVRYESK